MNDYARARGKSPYAGTDGDAESLAVPERRTALRPLNEQEQEAVARRRALVHEHMPELVPEIKALVDAGLIDGWRNVIRIEVFDTGEVA